MQESKHGVTIRMYYYMLDYKNQHLDEFQTRYWNGASLNDLTRIQLEEYFEHCTKEEISTLK